MAHTGWQKGISSQLDTWRCWLEDLNPATVEGLHHGNWQMLQIQLFFVSGKAGCFIFTNTWLGQAAALPPARPAMEARPTSEVPCSILSPVVMTNVSAEHSPALWLLPPQGSPMQGLKCRGREAEVLDSASPNTPEPVRNSRAGCNVISHTVFQMSP